MPSNTTNISQTVKGQNFDFHPMYLTDGMYAFAQNAVVEGFDGSGFPILQNEPSNILSVTIPSGFVVMGNVNVVEQQRIIWFLYNPTTGMSEIGETLNAGQCRKYVSDNQTTCDDCTSLNLSEKPPLETTTQVACSTYSTIQADVCFNFSNKYPINSVQYRITPCTLQIYFTDDNNNRRWLEFNYVNDDPTQGLVITPFFYQIIGQDAPPCENPIYGPDIDCNALNVQPNILTPCIEFIEEVNGGTLIAGVYQFFVAMSDVEGNKLSSYFSATNPIPVRTQDIAVETNYPTDKAIKLQILNLDPLGVFQHYILAVAKTIDNVTAFYQIGTFQITQTNYTYTGNNKSEKVLTADDIFALYPYYTTAGAVGQSNGILYWGNVNESVKPNLQRVANEISIQWQTIAIPESLYRQNQNAYRFRSYMRDEVYALGIQFIYESGEISNAYHIPGRSSQPSDLVIVNNNDSIQESDCADCEGTIVIPGTQVKITSVNTTTCTGSPVTPCNPTLNPNNAFQATACPLTPYSAAGCTPVIVSSSVGSVKITAAGSGYSDGSFTLAATGGTGTGLQLQLTVAGGAVTACTINASKAGIGYVLGDVVTAVIPGGSGFSATVQVVVPNPPTINAGANKTITAITPVSLSGSVSPTLSSNNIVSTLWQQLSGPNEAFIAAPTNLNTNWTGINTGTYVFQLCTTDIAGNTVNSSVTFTCTVPASSAPISNPGGDQVIVAPISTCNLTGLGSSDPSGIAQYTWSQVSGPNTAVFSSTSSITPSVSGLIAGTYQFQLEVTNNRDCSSIATTLVYVCADPCLTVPGCSQLISPINGSQVIASTTANLQWTTVSCALTYNVYLSTSPTSGYTLLTNTASNSYTATGLTPNTIYYWYIVPVNAIGVATGCQACYFSFVTSLNDSSQTCNKQRWQVYNTATLVGGDLDIYNGCEESCYQYGDMAYWESTDTYPLQTDPNYNIWGELCGLPIRHHKFPDSTVTHHHDLQNGTLKPNGGTYFQDNVVYPIGIKVNHTSVTAAIANAVTNNIITAQDAANIIGYRIVRGNRVGNKSVVCKGLLYDVNQYQRIDSTPGSPLPIIDQQPVYFSNFPYNDLRTNPFLTNDFRNYEKNNTPKGADLPFNLTNRYTFHSPDTHFNQPLPGNELKLETVEYGQAESYYENCDLQAREKILSEFSYGLAFAAAFGEIFADPKNLPQQQAQYTVKIARDEIDGSIDGTTGTDYTGTTFADGTGVYVGIPGTSALVTETTETNIPEGSLFGFDSSSGHFEDAALVNPPDTGQQIASGYSYTIHSTRGGLNQTMNPLSALSGPRSTGGLYPDIVYPIAVFFAGLSFLELIPYYLNIILKEMNIILDLIKALVPLHKWTIQFNSVGKYNNYSVVPTDQGIKRRVISAYAYIDGTNQTINEPPDPVTGQSDTIFYNNYNREDALYLKYDGTAFDIPDTISGIQDQSRTRISSSPFNCNLNSKQYLPISSYYGSIKNYVPDQYGTVYDIQYLRTDSCYFNVGTSDSVCQGVYGGDTFISRFALKIKVPYFLATTFRLPDGTDFDYSSVTNLAFPRNYFNNTNTVGQNLKGLSLSDLNPIALATDAYELLGGANSIRECAGSFLDGAPIFWQDGYIYLYHYGIPYFLCESDYNSDYRYGTNNQEGDFYPNQGNLHYWLQEENVPIDEPNTYYYNRTYSKQNEESFIGIDPANFQPGRSCRVDHPNRLIYSDPNRWLVYRANNFKDFPLNKGEIVSIDGIENESVIVRFPNSTSIFKSILRLNVDGQTAQVGNGSIFSNPPQDFADTTLGYIGSQHKAILHTEYGHIWVDAKRGQVFNVGAGGGSVDEISKDGMKNWFKENLPFRLLRSFPTMPEADLDNNYLGVGITMSFDKRFNRFVLTKLDWKCTDSSVTYNSTLRTFNKVISGTPTVINLGDPKYFKNCSWTMSYNFYMKSWTSSHSYKPNYYIDFIEFFGSGINGIGSASSSFWVHDLYNGSFQVFYGKICPFIVEPVLKFDEGMRQLNSIEFDTEVRRYSNEFDYTLKKSIPGFNKAIIYNDWYNSGLLELTNVDKNNFTLVGKYPIRSYNNWNIEVATANYKWRFNQFYALNRDNTEIPMWIYAGNNIDKSLNQSSFNYVKTDYSLARMKGQWFKERFINDSLSNYKILFKFSIDNQTAQIR